MAADAPEGHAPGKFPVDEGQIGLQNVVPGRYLARIPEDQAVRLDFGDMAISRSNHAAVVYDIKTHTFLLGHGGKANLVRLNGKPVVATHDLKDGDSIEIGETHLQFKSLCSTGFNWEQAEEQGEDDDVEIA